VFLLTAFSPALSVIAGCMNTARSPFTQINDKVMLFVAYNNVMSLKPTASILQQFDELAATAHEKFRCVKFMNASPPLSKFKQTTAFGSGQIMVLFC
jgi:hypothetical protein